MTAGKVPKPKAKDFYTNDGMHAAMKDYAEMKGHRGVLQVWAAFEYGQVKLFETCQRVEKPIQYKTRDGEVYEVMVATAKFWDPVWGDSQPQTKAQMIRLATEWLNVGGAPTTLIFMVGEG